METRVELMRVGERIRAYRRRKKLNQTELGKLIGYSMNGIAKIEQGNSDPKFSSLLKIAKALDTNIENLVGDMANEGAFQAALEIRDEIRALSDRIDLTNIEIIRRGGLLEK